MRVDVGLLVGNGPNAYAWASKTIDLNFAPVPGMEFSDGTWKGGDGRQIIAVSIECPPPPDKPYLAVALALAEAIAFVSGIIIQKIPAFSSHHTLNH